MKGFLHRFRDIMSKPVQKVPSAFQFIILIVIICILYFLLNFDPSYMINDDSDMFRMMDLKEYEDSLIKATGKGHLDTMDMSNFSIYNE